MSRQTRLWLATEPGIRLSCGWCWIACAEAQKWRVGDRVSDATRGPEDAVKPDLVHNFVDHDLNAFSWARRKSPWTLSRGGARQADDRQLGNLMDEHST